jgi:hypothetical protein
MNSQNACRALALAAMTFFFASSASAQTMYRCGSVYQDHPCEGAQAGKVVRNYGGAAATAPSTGDQDCKERGARSQKIVWAREAGASAEKQSAEARSADEQRLIAEVYRKRGSAPEVRAAIEADCVADKEKAAQAAALLAAALKAQQPAAAPAAPAAVAGQPDQAATNARDQQQQAAARAAESKKRRCEDLRARREAIVTEQRAAASVSQAEQLNRRRQDADNDLSKNGC